MSGAGTIALRKMRKLIKANHRKIRIQKLNLKTVRGLNKLSLLKLLRMKRQRK